jgi:hypothetical protein
MTLIVTAQELVLSVVLIRHQQQVPQRWLNVEDAGFGEYRSFYGNIEELAVGIVTDVDRNAFNLSPSIHNRRMDLRSSANPRELTLNLMHAHDIPFLKVSKHEE